MYLEARQNLPRSPLISPILHLSEQSIKQFIRNAYLAVGVVGITVAAAIVLGLLYPRFAGAFWPLSDASAAEGDTETLLHDPKLALLEAAVNPDPNPNKGGVPLSLSGGSALIASSGVEGTMPEAGGNGGGSISVYTVREGDSLSEIADMFGVSMNTILWANDITDAKTVAPGTTLVILPVSGIKHKVKSGETLDSIANKYDADAGDVAAFNGLGLGEPLEAGTEVIVPGGRIETPKAVVKKAAAKSSSSVAAKKAASSVALPAISGFFGNPLPGGRVSQGIHGYNGVDISAPAGTPIYAAAGGTVIVAKGGGGYNGGYGNYIVIDHGNGTQTLYAHMSSLAVSGGSVGKGTLIGYVGNTGRSTGNHLHFEVRGAKNPFAQ